MSSVREPNPDEARDWFQRDIPDTALWMQTDALRDHGSGTWLTLLVGGRMVTGRTASATEWHSSLQRQLGKTDDDDPAFVGQLVIKRGTSEARADREFIDALPEEAELTDEQRVHALSHSAHMHLVAGQVYSEGGQGAWIPTAGVPMRIRYTSVDAWWYGSMAPAAIPESSND
jgi:hypothetical protein